MKGEPWKETLVEQNVTYGVEVGGRFILVENVPSRVCLENGERFFSPETVERIHKVVWNERTLDPYTETLGFELD